MTGLDLLEGASKRLREEGSRKEGFAEWGSPLNNHVFRRGGIPVKGKRGAPKGSNCDLKRKEARNHNVQGLGRGQKGCRYYGRYAILSSLRRKQRGNFANR